MRLLPAGQLLCCQLILLPTESDMKRFICLAVALAVFAPLAVGDAEAAARNGAKKKSKQGPQVAGFVQTAQGTLKDTDKFGERNFYRDNTQRFFERSANSFN
jgi:hypothetical protein